MFFADKLQFSLERVRSKVEDILESSLYEPAEKNEILQQLTKLETLSTKIRDVQGDEQGKCSKIFLCEMDSEFGSIIWN